MVSAILLYQNGGTEDGILPRVGGVIGFTHTEALQFVPKTLRLNLYIDSPRITSVRVQVCE